MWLSKKYYKNLTIFRMKLCKTYEKLTTLQVSYKNVKFAASDVIAKPSVRGCYQILWAKNNWQPEWWFPKNAFENDLPFSQENLRKSYLADLQKIYENLTTKVRKILQKSYEVSKIGPQKAPKLVNKKTGCDWNNFKPRQSS